MIQGSKSMSDLGSDTRALSLHVWMLSFVAGVFSVDFDFGGVGPKPSEIESETWRPSGTYGIPSLETLRHLQAEIHWSYGLEGGYKKCAFESCRQVFEGLFLDIHRPPEAGA